MTPDWSYLDLLKKHPLYPKPPSLKVPQAFSLPTLPGVGNASRLASGKPPNLFQPPPLPGVNTYQPLKPTVPPVLKPKPEIAPIVPTSTTPVSETSASGLAFTGTATAPVTEPVKQPIAPTIYTPNPQGSTKSTDYNPLLFPGVETETKRGKTYADGTVIDYSSAAWQKALKFKPPEGGETLWEKIPDSWKSVVAGWKKPYADMWVLAQTNPWGVWIFEGQRLTGMEIKGKIEAIVKQESDDFKYKLEQKKQFDIQRGVGRIVDVPRPYFIPK